MNCTQYIIRPFEQLQLSVHPERASVHHLCQCRHIHNLFLEHILYAGSELDRAKVQPKQVLCKTHFNPISANSFTDAARNLRKTKIFSRRKSAMTSDKMKRITLRSNHQRNNNTNAMN
ncbi:unnamed protein product [marine sediment metagenome]|uniref:Uncharacterized protein n=1 Tax=marine sediment metagenome TaxID=412755 RepID=X1S538_9ZZZZ